MTPVEMPKANENMAEATLHEWIVKEGQRVSEDEGLCTIVTDKATFEMPSPAAGVIRKILGEPRSMLPVGYVMCLIGEPDEAVSDAYADRNAVLLEAHRGAVAGGRSGGSEGAVAEGGARAVAGGKVRATPAARRAAKAAGVSLEEVKAALGVEGVLGEKDMEAYNKQREG